MTAVVSDFDLDIEQGESVALWGPNGAGKTTVARCMRPASTSSLWDGVVKLPATDGLIGHHHMGHHQADHD